MGADTFISSGTTGKRQAKRNRVLLAAKLETPFGEVEARLRDLSRQGALLECAKVPPVGSEVTFVRGSTAIPARVAWSGGNRVGIEFAFMIDEADLMVQLKRTNGSGQTIRFRRPGLGERMSDRDRKLAQSWGVTVGLNIPDHD